MIFGLLVGIAFTSVRKRKHYRIWIGVISAIAPKIHSLLVYTTMGILFPELGYNYSSAFHWNLNNTVFTIICVIVVELLWAIYQSDTIQNIKCYIDQSINNPYASGKMNLAGRAICRTAGDSGSGLTTDGSGIWRTGRLY